MIVFLGKVIIGLILVTVIGTAFGLAFNDCKTVMLGEDSEQKDENKRTGGFSDEDDDFIMSVDAMSIARGENPLDPEAKWKSITDPQDLFGDD